MGYLTDSVFSVIFAALLIASNGIRPCFYFMSSSQCRHSWERWVVLEWPTSGPSWLIRGWKLFNGCYPKDRFDWIHYSKHSNYNRVCSFIWQFQFHGLNHSVTGVELSGTDILLNLTHWGRVTQICVFNTRLFSLHNKLNYAIHRAYLRMVLLMDVYRNLTSLWINLQAPRFLYIGTGVSLLSREHFSYI